MMNTILKISNKKSLIISFLISDLLIKFSKFLVLPLLIIYLSASEFGKLEYYLSYASFFSSFLGPGLYNWLLNKRGDRNKVIFFVTLKLYFFWFSLVFLITLAYSLLYEDYLLLIIVLYSFSNSLYLFLMSFVKILRQYKLYFKSALFLFLLDFVLVSVLLLENVGFLSRIIGSLIAFSFVFIVVYIVLLRNKENNKKYKEFSYLREVLVFFTPFFFFGLAGFFTTSYAKIIVGDADADGFIRLASMGLALQILSIIKLSSDSIVKTINSVYIISTSSQESGLSRYYWFSFIFVIVGYVFMILLNLAQPYITIEGYPELFDDLIIFSPSRILMVLNLYIVVIITTLLGSKVLYVSALVTIFVYLIGIPYAFDAGGVSDVAKFDFSYNILIFVFYNSYLLWNIELKNRGRNLIIVFSILIFLLGYFLFYE